MTKQLPCEMLQSSLLLRNSGWGNGTARPVCMSEYQKQRDAGVRAKWLHHHLHVPNIEHVLRISIASTINSQMNQKQNNENISYIVSLSLHIAVCKAIGPDRPGKMVSLIGEFRQVSRRRRPGQTALRSGETSQTLAQQFKSG